MVIMVMKAGNASLILLRSRSFTLSSMSTPTRTSAPLVAAEGMSMKIGERKSDIKKSSPTTNEVMPLRPPSATPAALST
jgi:hypothetical protein